MKRLPTFHVLEQGRNIITRLMKANAAYRCLKMAAAGEGDGKNSLNPGTCLSLYPVGRTPGFVETRCQTRPAMDRSVPDLWRMD